MSSNDKTSSALPVHWFDGEGLCETGMKESLRTDFDLVTISCASFQVTLGSRHSKFKGSSSNAITTTGSDCYVHMC